MPHVKHRDLSGNQLSGTLPPSLASLTAMTNLCVRFSALPIRTSLQPHFQTSMCSDLHGNQLSGTVPQSFGSLTGLTWLCVLSFLLLCKLAAVLHPVRSDLSYNQLSGTIPSSLGSLTRLSNLCVTCGPPPAVLA